MEKYDVKKVVGQGSYGKAVLCKRKVDARLCIIKQISIKKMSRKEALLTEQEATLLKRLQHPNIVSFWESFMTNNSLYIVMEYADGGDLDNYIKSFVKSVPRREIPEKQVLHMFVQLALAIKHIHDRKILHRDLKSQNVFLTASGQLKLGDFGVSRVLRHTVELAATQIGTPYYMSPEIMDNQRYNSKTDIWSLGCILYELMCLRLPFDGSSMKQLCYNIIKTTPKPPSSTSYTPELRELVRDVLLKNPKARPGINAILARPIMRTKISNLLGETTKHAEFSHTVLHGANVLNAPPIAVPPASAGGAVARALNPPSVAAPSVASSAAQAVAMLQQQRQQQLLKQQQHQAQQQQYVGAMAAQMKEQVELARKAEADRVRAQQLQAEEQQRRIRQQAQERARIDQARLVDQQKAVAKARAAELALKEKQNQDRLDKARRAALAEQQQKLERKREERLKLEAQQAKLAREREKEKEREREREKAQRARIMAYQQAPAPVPSSAPSSARVPSPRVSSASPSSVAPAVMRKAPVPSAAAVVPLRKPPSKCSPAPSPAPSPVPSVGSHQAKPVRNFSAGALLAKRRHSAPEKSPLPIAARPPWVSVLEEPEQKQNPFLEIVGSVPSQPPPVKVPLPKASEQQSRPPISLAPSPSESPKPDPRAGAAVVGASAGVRGVSSPDSGPSKGKGNPVLSVPQSPSTPQTPVPVPVPYARSPASAASGGGGGGRPIASPSNRQYEVDGAIAKAQHVLQAMQDMQANQLQRGKKPTSAVAAAMKECDSTNTSYGSILPDTPPSAKSSHHINPTANHNASDSDEAEDTAESAAVAITPLLPPPTHGKIRIDTSDTASNSYLNNFNSKSNHPAVRKVVEREGEREGEGGSDSPWLSDLMGQMGQLKNQMHNLQQLRSPASAGGGAGAAAGADSPYYRPSPIHCRDAAVEAEEDESSSGVSSITALSPSGSVWTAASGPSSANTPRDSEKVTVSRAINRQQQQYQQQQQPHRIMQERAKQDRQRMSFPLADSSVSQKRHLPPAPLALESNYVADDDVSVGSGASSSLAQRKESRDRQRADFKAFVQAQRDKKGGGGGGGRGGGGRGGGGGGGGGINSSVDHEKSVHKQAPPAVSAASPHFEIQIPTPHMLSGGAQVQQKNTPPLAKKGFSVGKKQNAAPASKAKSGISPTPVGGKASKINQTGSSQKSTHSVASSHSALSQVSSSTSLASPRTADGTGFSVAERRNQREAQRKEMRLMMQEHRKQLRKAAAQLANDEVEVLAHDPAPSPFHAETAAESDDNYEQAQVKANSSDAGDDYVYEEDEPSKLFAQLQDDTLNQIPVGIQGLAQGGATMLEYSVLIEQMQAILRMPGPGRTATKQAFITDAQAQLAAASSYLSTPTTYNDKNKKLLVTGRALVADLLLEEMDEEDEADVDTGISRGKNSEVNSLECEEQQEQQHGEEVEHEHDPDDEFGEEDDPITQAAAAIAAQCADDEDDEHSKQVGDTYEKEGSDFEELQEGEEDADESAELLEFPDRPNSDPFMQPLVPAMLTVDALLLMDPLRHAFSSGSDTAATAVADHNEEDTTTNAAVMVAPLSTPVPSHQQQTENHINDTDSVDRDKARRLRIAELQEYLVSKLGSAKVSQALHLLAVNTAATLTPSDAAQTDSYYDERDEALLNRVEEILGTDCLHYLDDMFLLLTMQ